MSRAASTTLRCRRSLSGGQLAILHDQLVHERTVFQNRPGGRAGRATNRANCVYLRGVRFKAVTGSISPRRRRQVISTRIKNAGWLPR